MWLVLFCKWLMSPLLIVGGVWTAATATVALAEEVAEAGAPEGSTVAACYHFATQLDGIGRNGAAWPQG